MNICLVLGDRSLWDGESALPTLAGCLAALTGRVLLMVPDTALMPPEVKRRLTPYARFHVRSGDRLLPVEVEQWQSNDVSWFIIGLGDTVMRDQPLSSSCFAAACTALAGLILNKEGLKLDWLHIHHWSALPVALLVKKYYKVPYIYSVHSLSGQKTPVKDLEDLGISLNREYPLLGGMLFTEHVAGMEAEYVVCEDTGLMVKEWNSFFCAFDGKIIAGLPVVDADFWCDTGNLPRSARRNELLAGYGAENGVTVIMGEDNEATSGLPPDFIAVTPDADPLKKREQLQAADFYLLTGECVRPRELLAAMAAGCIPVTAESRFAREVVYCEEEWPRRANGYLYNNKKETVTEVLARAGADLGERPEWVATLRQRGKDMVKDLYGLQSAAVFNHKIYCGMADIKLPFVVM